MNNLNKIFVFISAASIIFILSVVFHKIWVSAQRAALHSCMSNIVGDIVEHSNEIGNFAQSSKNWYVLTDGQVKAILLDERVKFEDCSQLNSKPQDMKEKTFRVAVRKNSEYGFSVMAWSKGFDNISGTENDIVIPYDEKVPE